MNRRAQASNIGVTNGACAEIRAVVLPAMYDMAV